MKTIIIAKAYTELKNAKLSKMEDADKFKVIEAMREMRPVSEKYEADEKETLEKLKDEKYDEMTKRAQKHNLAVDQKKTDGLMTPKEMDEAGAYFKEWEKQTSSFLNGIQEKEVKMKFNKLTKEAFSKLIDSNDMKLETIMLLDEVLM